VGVTAKVMGRFKQRDLRFPTQGMSGGQSRNARTYDGNFHWYKNSFKLAGSILY
jgi:hypothetical protein